MHTYTNCLTFFEGAIFFYFFFSSNKKNYSKVTMSHAENQKFEKD